MEWGTLCSRQSHFDQQFIKRNVDLTKTNWIVKTYSNTDSHELGFDHQTYKILANTSVDSVCKMKVELIRDEERKLAKSAIYYPSWLVVWNIFYFSLHWEFHHPN